MMNSQKSLNTHQTIHADAKCSDAKESGWYDTLPHSSLTSIAVNHSATEEDICTAQIAINWGTQSQQLQQFGQAIEYFRIALQIYTQAENPLGISKSLNGLSAVYLERQQYERARAYSQASIAILEVAESTASPATSEDYALATYQLGVSYLKLHNLPQAEAYLTQALSLYTTLQDAVSEDYVTLYLGQLYTQHQEYLFALAAYESVLDSLLERPQHESTHALLKHLLNFITAICEATQQADIAYLPYKRALEQSIMADTPETMSPIFHQLGQFYESQQRYGLSVACYAQTPQTAFAALEV